MASSRKPGQALSRIAARLQAPISTCYVAILPFICGAIPTLSNDTSVHLRPGVIATIPQPGNVGKWRTVPAGAKEQLFFVSSSDGVDVSTKANRLGASIPANVRRTLDSYDPDARSFDELRLLGPRC